MTGIDISATNDLPLVSIGLVMYRCEGAERLAWLSEGIRSLVNQTYKNIEVVVSDDGSPDSTIQLLRDLLKTVPCVQIIRQRKHINMIENWAAPFHASQGKYFFWVSDHDVYAPTFIETLVAELERNPDTALVYSQTQQIGGKGEPAKVFQDNIDVSGLTPEGRFLKIIASLGSCNQICGVFRSSVLDQCEHFIYTRGHDHVLLAEVSLLGEIKQVPEILYYRRESREPQPFAESEKRLVELQFRKEDAFHRMIPWHHLAYSHLMIVERHNRAQGEYQSLHKAVAGVFARRFGRLLRTEAQRLWDVKEGYESGTLPLTPVKVVQLYEAVAILRTIRGLLTV